MKLERTENAKRNIVWGVANKLIKTILPFIVRTIIIYRLGDTYVGLNSLFTSVLSTLSLAELGFDTAVVAMMYKCVATEDNISINALLAFIRRVYYVVGAVILVLGVTCIPFLPYMIKDYDSVPCEINASYIFCIFLLNTVTTYFFGGYRNCVLQAYQRQDIISNINTIVSMAFFLIEIFVLIVFGDYYVYLYFILISNIFVNLCVYIFSRKYYPGIFPNGKVDSNQLKEIKKLVFGTFMGKVGGVLSLSFDNIVISSFIGMKILAYYSNYSYIISSLQGFLAAIYLALQAGVGNSLVLESREKNYNDMLKFSFLFNWIVGWTSICLMLLLTPFVHIWAGAKSVLPFSIQTLIVLDFYVVMCGSIQGIYKIALGIWWEDRYRCIIAGLVNLCLNITFVLVLKSFNVFYALGGVVLSTIVADLCIATPWSIKVTFKNYFHEGMFAYVKFLIKFFMVTVANCLICMCITHFVDTYIQHQVGSFATKLMIALIVPNLFYFSVYRRDELYAKSISFVKTRLMRG